VPGKLAKADPLFATTWVHVFEEDNAKGAVYRAEDDASIPLSRRPRERLRFRPDGSASISGPGPDDRNIEQPATWREEDGALVISACTGDARLRILKRSPSRLVVQFQKAEHA
jgi:hypothetical protein